MSKGFWIAVKFLTILPSGGEAGEKELGKSTFFFPAVGLLIGSILAGISAGASILFASPLSNALTLLSLIVITGGIHLDGLADTVDGLCSGGNKERVLKVMRDSRVGTMGVLAIIFSLLLKFFSLQEMKEWVRLRALILMPTIGRWALVLSSYNSPYARGGVLGIGKAFTNNVKGKEVTVATITALTATLLLEGVVGVFLFSALTILILSIHRLIKSKINGMTGDTLGAMCESAEVLTLLGIVAIERW